MMKTAKRLAGMAATMAGIAGVGMVIATGNGPVTAAPPNQGPQQVLVVNGGAQAVPVVAQGTTEVAGMVSVGNTVTTHLDSNVVTVDTSTPLDTRDTDAGTPVSIHLSGSAGGFSVGATRFYSVPGGKRLVIEHVSGRLIGGADGEHVLAKIEWAGGFGGSTQKHYLIPTALAGDDRLVSTPIRMYFGPGELVGVGYERNAATSSMDTMEFQLSGRLVDVP